MIESNSGLFARLSGAGGDAITADLRAQRRAVRTSDDEKGWLQRVTFTTPSHLRLDATSRFALAQFADDLYLVAIAVDIEEPPTELERISLNAGLFTAIVSDLNVPILRSPDFAERLLEYVFYPVDQGCELIDMEIVVPFFQRIEVFRIDPSSAIASDDELGVRAAIAAVLRSPVLRPLDWSTEALDRFAFMVRDPAERAPFHLLLRALTESRDDAAFLALYRCIEQLFPIPAMGLLSTELGLSQPALEVAAVLERHLGWRRREEDAIANLFADLEDHLIDRLFVVVGAAAQDQGRFRPVSKRIYELRNHCVHFRPAQALGEPTVVGDWASLTALMLEAVQALYAHYKAAFDPSATAPAT